MTQKLTIAYVTDAGLFTPTLLSAHSALEHAREPLHLLFVGRDLTDEMWRAVDVLASLYPNHTVWTEPMPEDWLTGAVSPKDFITVTALGRLFLPRLTDGRVLYLDGDTLVTGDLSQARRVDLRGQPLGAVRDYAMMSWVATGKTAQVQRQARLLGGHDMSGYVNSGVLLMDADLIRSEPALLSAMGDIEAAQGFPTVDQDRINILFRGRITHLDPAWNCSWGRLRRQRRDQRGLSVTDPHPCPLILHYHGPHKPWHPLRLSTLRKGALAVLRYRRARAELRRDESTSSSRRLA